MDSWKAEDVARLYDECAQAFSEFAPDSYLWRHLERPLFRDEIAHCQEKGIEQALDVGCASGRVAGVLVEGGVKESQLTGIDGSGELIARARQNFPQAKFIQGNAGEYVFEKNYFTLATAHMVFEFMDNETLSGAYKNIFESLKPGGTLFFVSTHPGKMMHGRTEKPTESFWFTTSAPWGVEIPTFHRPLEEFTDLLKRSGFTVEKVREVSLPESARAEDPARFEKYTAYGPMRIAITARKPEGVL